jgi:hypothetical protein
MILLELVAQGVMGFGPSVRAALRTGYNVLIPSTGSSPPLCDLLTALLYSDGRGGDASLAAPGVKVARVGITFIAKDQKTYRMLRQLGGPGALHVLEAGQFKLISQDAVEISQYATASLGLPTRTMFTELFCFSPRFFPSRQPKPLAVEAAPRPSNPRLSATAAAALAPVEAQVAPAEAKARIEDLKKEALTSKKVADLQFHLDGLNGKLFEAEERLKSIKVLEEELATAKRVVESSPSAEKLGLDPDIVERAKAFAERTRQRDDALAKLESDKVALEESQGIAPPAPWTDTKFAAAIGAGALAVIVGILLRAGAGRYLALFDIVAFGYAAFLALKYVDDVQTGSTSGRKLARMGDRETKIREQYENDVRSVKAAMGVAGVDDPKELVEVFGKRADAEAKVREAETALEGARNDPELRSARAKRDAIQAEVERVEAELQKYGTGYVREVREIEAEIAKLASAIAAAERGDVPAAVAPATSLGGSFEAGQGPAGPARLDPSPRLLAYGVSILGGDLATLGNTLGDRITQYFYALADQRYTQVKFDIHGFATITAPGRTLPAGDLPPEDLDTLHLAIKLALVERSAPTAKVPAILDDCFGRQAESKLKLISRMLKHIGSATQVIHVAREPTHRSLADASAPL